MTLPSWMATLADARRRARGQIGRRLQSQGTERLPRSSACGRIDDARTSASDVAERRRTEKSDGSSIASARSIPGDVLVARWRKADSVGVPPLDGTIRRSLTDDRILRSPSGPSTRVTHCTAQPPRAAARVPQSRASVSHHIARKRSQALADSAPAARRAAAHRRHPRRPPLPPRRRRAASLERLRASGSVVRAKLAIDSAFWTVTEPSPLTLSRDADRDRHAPLGCRRRGRPTASCPRLRLAVEPNVRRRPARDVTIGRLDVSRAASLHTVASNDMRDRSRRAVRGELMRSPRR